MILTTPLDCCNRSGFNGRSRQIEEQTLEDRRLNQLGSAIFSKQSECVAIRDRRCDGKNDRPVDVIEALEKRSRRPPAPPMVQE